MMPEPERKRRCFVSCEPSDVWLKTCRNCGNPNKDVSEFIGYDVLPTRPLPVGLPGETLAEYHQRVYGRAYPHERLWPGTMLVREADVS